MDWWEWSSFILAIAFGGSWGSDRQKGEGGTASETLVPHSASDGRFNWCRPQIHGILFESAILDGTSIYQNESPIGIF
jgi:hypothetical protein